MAKKNRTQPLPHVHLNKGRSPNHEPAAGRKTTLCSDSERARKWLNSYPAVRRWLSQYDIHKLLKQGNGLVRIPNFLPDYVAKEILCMLEQVPEAHWSDTSAQEDYRQNNIAHRFWSTKKAKGLELVFRVIAQLAPDSFHTFSAARYDQNHHIAPHDDRAYTQVLLDTGGTLTCSRDVAVIYYLTRDWREEWGGVLVDLQGSQRLVPMFNSAVMFEVPRWHEVTALTGQRPRYSIFGWFLTPGHKYPLQTGEQQWEHVSVKAGAKAPQSARLSGDSTRTKKKQRTHLVEAAIASDQYQASEDVSKAYELEADLQDNHNDHTESDLHLHASSRAPQRLRRFGTLGRRKHAVISFRMARRNTAGS